MHFELEKKADNITVAYLEYKANWNIVTCKIVANLKERKKYIKWSICQEKPPELELIVDAFDF